MTGERAARLAAHQRAPRAEDRCAGRRSRGRGERERACAGGCAGGAHGAPARDGSARGRWTRPGGEGGDGAPRRLESRLPFSERTCPWRACRPRTSARACPVRRACRGADCRPRRRSCASALAGRSRCSTPSRTTGSCFDTTMPSPEIAGAHKPIRARASARHPPGGGRLRARALPASAEAQTRARARPRPRERARAHSAPRRARASARVGAGTQRASKRVSAARAHAQAHGRRRREKMVGIPPIRAKKKKTGAGRNGPPRARGRWGCARASQRAGLPPRGARPPGLPTACQRAWRERLGGTSGRRGPSSLPPPRSRARATKALQKFPLPRRRKYLPGARHRTAHSPGRRDRPCPLRVRAPCSERAGDRRARARARLRHLAPTATHGSGADAHADACARRPDTPQLDYEVPHYGVDGTLRWKTQARPEALPQAR